MKYILDFKTRNFIHITKSAWGWDSYRHYNDAIMSAMASQTTSLTIVYATVHSGEDQRKHQSSMSMAIVGEFHRWPVNSPHKGPVTRKMSPFDDVIMVSARFRSTYRSSYSDQSSRVYCDVGGVTVEWGNFGCWGNFWSPLFLPQIHNDAEVYVP